MTEAMVSVVVSAAVAIPLGIEAAVAVTVVGSGGDSISSTMVWVEVAIVTAAVGGVTSVACSITAVEVATNLLTGTAVRLGAHEDGNDAGSEVEAKMAPFMALEVPSQMSLGGLFRGSWRYSRCWRLYW
jgi:hypothetical protein